MEAAKNGILPSLPGQSSQPHPQPVPGSPPQFAASLPPSQLGGGTFSVPPPQFGAGTASAPPPQFGAGTPPVQFNSVPPQQFGAGVPPQQFGTAPNQDQFATAPSQYVPPPTDGGVPPPANWGQ
jgi:hypothetical protein